MSDSNNDNVPTSTTTPAMSNPEPAAAVNVAAPVTVAERHPIDVMGLHQLTGADLERFEREVYLREHPPSPTASTPRRSSPTEFIEVAASPVTTPPSNALILADVVQWPDPVNGADVLNEVAATISRYVVLQEGAADAVALWILHTHCYEALQFSPRLNLSSPERGCGKTTLRDVIAALVPRPLLAENLTPAVLFRLIDEQQPTVLVDEYDAWLTGDETLRGILNSGHRRGGQVYRYDGRAGQTRGFTVFAPVVLCGIGTLPVTLLDRSITVSLKRARPGEIHERFDSRRVVRETELCHKIARFCADNEASIEACNPVLPPGAVNRLADNWRPLFAIAEIAGGEWPRRAAAAFAKLVVQDVDDQGICTMLLADIRQVFTAGNAERVSSEALVEALCTMEDRPWLEAHRGRRINKIWLANQLRPYRIAPTTLRIGRNLKKGYRTADFQDAFERYLPPAGQSSRNAVTRA